MKPCFGLSLQTGVLFIAILDIINSVVIIVVISLQTSYSGQWVVIGLETANILFGCVLAQGASKRCMVICKCWVVYTVFQSLTLTSHIAYQLVVHFSDQNAEQDPEELTVTFAYIFLYKAYAIYVTLKFIAEVHRFGGLNDVLVHLSDKDVEDFLYGTLAEDDASDARPQRSSAPLRTVYDKKYEISLQQLQIEPTLLGSGKYGRIYSGNLLIPAFQQKRKGESGTETVISFERKRVAVKTLENSKADLIYFKSLLSELKIMIYLGEHPNIVTLHGVCTAEIHKKNLWIVLELCEFGSLHRFLHTFEGIRDLDFQSPLPSNHNFLCLAEIYKWAAQMADALQYMETKHVVHGDISTRNVLVASDRNVKISDFGLSRKLMQAQSQSEWEDVPLPWRWMAIESLQSLKFSSKSDVWSYAVAIWEIFTLGQTPFSGASWNVEFIKQLAMGCRLNKPKECPSEIYDVMLRCWKRHPCKRPSFAELSVQFQNYPKN